MQLPFTSVVGQPTFKLALLLVAINPKVGGVLISGPRGCAKSTLAKALAELLPDENQAFVNVPIGVSEDRLLGSLDLQQVLQQQQVNFKPGLLAQAHQGILYVDEVNLLADYLVDNLLDVSTSGVNVVEREGVSHRHAAEFVLLGTMNPDEGELRAQLLDRFGLCVQLQNSQDLQCRLDIMHIIEQCEQDAPSFLASFHSQQQQLRQKIQRAQGLLHRVTIDLPLKKQIAQLCLQAQVDGMRADLVMLQAAKAHAALQLRTEVTGDDIVAVSELVLAHRRQSSAQQAQTDKTTSKQANSEQPNSEQSNSEQPNSKQENSKQPNSKQENHDHSLSKGQPQPPSSVADTQASNADAASSQTIGLVSSETERDHDGQWGQMPAHSAPISSTALSPHSLDQQIPDIQRLITQSSSDALQIKKKG